MSLGKLKRRSDFVAVRDCGVYLRFRSINVQLALASFSHEEHGCVSLAPEGWKDLSSVPVFVGITTSRKVGNAVLRNYARRRIRTWVQARLTEITRSLVFMGGSKGFEPTTSSSSSEGSNLEALTSETPASVTLASSGCAGVIAPRWRQAEVRLLTLSKPSLATLPKNQLRASRALVVVIIATAKTPEVSFRDLSADLEQALDIGLKKLIGKLGNIKS